MILIASLSGKGQDCARAISEAVGEEVQVASSLRQGLTHLRSREYSAVLLDQAFLESEPEESEIVLQHLGMAVPVYINFAISGIERVLGELRTALHRRRKEVLLARQGAQQALRNELKSTVTALLLSCEMALKTPNLQTAAEAKMRAVYELAQEMRTKLEVHN